MKFLTPSALWRAALFSAGIVVPFLPGTRHNPPDFAFDALLSSSVDSTVQLYYDSGSGFREPDSVRLPLFKADAPRRYRFPLPAGDYVAFRLDPADRDGVVTIHGAAVLGVRGRTEREVRPGSFVGVNQIQSIRRQGEAAVVTVVPGGDDPQLRIDLDAPVHLGRSRIDTVIDWLARGGVVFGALALLLLALDRLEAPRRRLARALAAAAARPVLAVWLAAAAAVVLSAYPVVFLGRSHVSPSLGTILLYDQFPTLPGDAPGRPPDVKGADIGAVMWQHVPFSTIQHRSLLKDGELPVWNRYDSAGAPLLGQGQSMFGDPLHLLAIAADGAAWAWDLKYLAAKCLLAAGVGLLVLSLARHLPAALLASLSAPFSGLFVYRINHPAFFSFCYAPWPLYCWVRLARAERSRSVAGWCAGLILANAALMNSGTVKEAYVLLVVMNFSGACVLLASELPWRRRLARLGAAAWAGAIFAALTAPVWFTFLQALGQSYTSYEAAAAYQVQPGLLLAAFDEAFFRPLVDQGRVFNPSANFLVLAGVCYFLATLRSQSANRAGLAIAAATAAVMALAFGLVPSAWIARVPFFAHVLHLDDCLLCALIVLWSVLAGLGFAVAARRLGGPAGRGDLAIAGLILFALVFNYWGFAHAAHRPAFGPGSVFSALKTAESIPVAGFLRAYLGALLIATAGLGILARRCLVRGQVGAGSALGLALCLGALLWRFGLQAESAGFEDYVVRPGPRADFHAPSEAVRFLQEAVRASPGRVAGLGNNLFPGWSAVYGLEGITGPDALMSPRYRELAGASPLERIWDWRLHLSAANLQASRPFLDFLNVRYYVDLRSNPATFGATFKRDLGADLDVYESPTAWPRAFFTDRISTYADAADLVRRINQGDGRPFAAALSSDLDAFPALAALSGDPTGRTVTAARNYVLTENSTSFDVDATGPGVVVLDEALWPGDCHAEVDGHKAAVWPMNHAFQGVAIDGPGTHHVALRYRPHHFPLALALAGGGLLLLAASLGLVWRSTAPRRP